MITTRKAARAIRAALPGWLVIAFGACLVIPGPFDELAAVLACLVLCAVHRRGHGGRRARGAAVRAIGRTMAPSESGAVPLITGTVAMPARSPNREDGRQ